MQTINIFDNLYKRILSKDLYQHFQDTLRALRADFDHSKAIGMLSHNFTWLISNKIIVIPEVKRWFLKEILEQQNIFTEGSHILLDQVAVGL
ncbi:MAG: hypothetical protein ABI045_04080 [Flavobacteriales bacterium]